jgi:hypothetical protein
LHSSTQIDDEDSKDDPNQYDENGNKIRRPPNRFILYRAAQQDLLQDKPEAERCKCTALPLVYSNTDILRT